VGRARRATGTGRRGGPSSVHGRGADWVNQSRRYEPHRARGQGRWQATSRSDYEVTLSEVLPTTLPEVALIVVLPTVRVVAVPADVIVATVVLDEAQMTEAVRF